MFLRDNKKNVVYVNINTIASQIPIVWDHSIGRLKCHDSAAYDKLSSSNFFTTDFHWNYFIDGLIRASSDSGVWSGVLEVLTCVGNGLIKLKKKKKYTKMNKSIKYGIEGGARESGRINKWERRLGVSESAVVSPPPLIRDNERSHRGFEFSFSGM